MQVVDKLMMCTMPVADMEKSKEFYADKLGLAITTDYRQDEDHWWVSLAFPEGGSSITLSTYHDKTKPGSMVLYFQTSDVEASSKALAGKDVKVSPVQDDLFGPGSGVKWFNFSDPDGNQITLAQKHDTRAPF